MRAKAIRLNAICLAKMIAHWMDQPCGRDELADVSGLHVLTCSRFINALHKEGAVHIHAWERDSLGRVSTRKVFAFGPGRDAPKPKAESKTVSNARYLAKRQQMLMQRAIAGMAA